MKLLVLSLLFCGAVAQTNDTTAPPVTESDLGEGASTLLGHRAESSPGNWQTFNGRRFIFMEISVTWAHAQQHCLALGGNLATIHNRNEDDIVKALAGGRVAWIGLSDAQAEGFWFWINSKPLEYTNWCPREPNNAGGQQHCGRINYSDNKCWDDYQCNESHPYVCERE